MLVLGRHTGESIIVTLDDGRRIRVVVVRASEGVARIGIEAPANVRIVREEIENVPQVAGAEGER